MLVLITVAKITTHGHRASSGLCGSRFNALLISLVVICSWQIEGQIGGFALVSIIYLACLRNYDACISARILPLHDPCRRHNGWSHSEIVQITLPFFLLAILIIAILLLLFLRIRGGSIHDHFIVVRGG